MKSPRESAMDFLARREYSRADLRSRLIAKSYEEDEVDAVIDCLTKEGLQSDVRYTEAYIRSRTRAGHGPISIKAELYQHGIAADLIEQHLSVDESYWLEQLEAVWQKKYQQAPTDEKEYARQMRFLLQRGFGASLIHNLLHNLPKEQEVL